MTIEIGSTSMSSNETEHQARSVGEGMWVTSFLPGRTLSREQAVAAMQIAAFARYLDDLASPLGLTASEAVGMAAMGSTWPTPERHTATNRVRWWR